MPTYEYLCSSCGKTFDVFQSMGDDPVNKCPTCGNNVRRIISGGTGFIMKGSCSMEMPSCGKAESCCAHGSCGMHNESH